MIWPVDANPTFIGTVPDTQGCPVSTVGLNASSISAGAYHTPLANDSLLDRFTEKSTKQISSAINDLLEVIV